jgi:hypothetical protein
MKIVMLGLIGLFLGAIAGGVIGIGLGLLWINVFHTSDFEGYSGMLVFYSFMPIGIIVGALTGAVGLGFVASRDASPASLEQLPAAVEERVGAVKVADRDPVRDHCAEAATRKPGV